MNPARDRLLDAALDAARRGWSVFPLRPGDKRPAIRDWQGRATTDRARIVRCWSAGPFNIGIACGPSEIVVVDLDVAKNGADDDARPASWAARGVRDGRGVLAALAQEASQPVPLDTFTVTTGSGGTHLYFTAPAGEPLRNTAGRLGWLVDTRADGGYVVAAGSVVAGRVYVVAADRPPAPLPRWIDQRLRPATVATADSAVVLAAISDRSRYAEAALRQEIERVVAAEPGTRNHTLNTAAYSLGRLVAAGLLPENGTADALRHAGTSAGLADREATATVRSGLTAGARRPRSLSC